MVPEHEEQIIWTKEIHCHWLEDGCIYRIHCKGLCEKITCSTIQLIYSMSKLKFNFECNGPMPYITSDLNLQVANCF